MKNPNESTSTADELPGFLQLDEVAHDSIASESMSGSSTDTTAPADTPSLDDSGDPSSTDTVDANLDETTNPATPSRQSRRRANVAPASAGTVSTYAGFGVIAAAIALAAAPLAPTLRDNLSQFGIHSASLLVVGTVLAASGTNRRRLAALQQRLDENGGSNADGVASLRDSVQFLVEAQHASNERPPAAGEELQHVLVALQRQDDKVNNLTKAIKMYGKPLMEISGQGTEIAGAVAQTKAAVEASNDAAQKAFAHVRQQLQEAAGTHKEIADLTDIVLKVSSMVEVLQKKQTGSVSLEPLQQQVGRLEVAVAAIAQRVEDNELRKSLLRLEDSTQKAREDVQHLLRGEGLQKATTQLQERLDKATSRVTDGITQLRDNNVSGLETSIREMQRELSGVATSLAQIQAVVKSGGRAAIVASQPTAAPTPAPAAPAPAAPPAPSNTVEGQPAAPTTPAATPAAAPTADGGSNGYQTGKRTSTGKNVLGAIAKLKQMKN